MAWQAACEISRLMFAGYNIDAITNGVHGQPGQRTPSPDFTTGMFPLAAGQLQPALRSLTSRRIRQGSDSTIFRANEALRASIKIAYLKNYNRKSAS